MLALSLITAAISAASALPTKGQYPLPVVNPFAESQQQSEDQWTESALREAEAASAGFTKTLLDRDVQPAMAGLFSSDNYPLTAVAARQEGKVGVYLRIGADGQLKDCLVVQSSGVPALDSQTCRVFWTRGRFVAAHDQSGKAVESASVKRVTWKLRDSSRMPLSPWSRRTVITATKGAEPPTCEEQVSGPIELGGSCRLDVALWGPVALAAARSAGKPKVRLILETRFSPGPITPGDVPSGMTIVSRDLSRIDTDPNGRITDCQLISSQGPMGARSDCSDAVKELEFEPADGAAQGPSTVEQTVYTSAPLGFSAR